MQRPATSFHRFLLAVGIVLLLVFIGVFLGSCHPRYYPQARPKYGDSTTPVGPSRDAFKSQPKFQP